MAAYTNSEQISDWSTWNALGTTLRNVTCCQGRWLSPHSYPPTMYRPYAVAKSNPAKSIIGKFIASQNGGAPVKPRSMWKRWKSVTSKDLSRISWIASFAVSTLKVRLSSELFQTELFQTKEHHRYSKVFILRLHVQTLSGKLVDERNKLWSANLSKNGYGYKCCTIGYVCVVTTCIYLCQKALLQYAETKMVWHGHSG